MNEPSCEPRPARLLVVQQDDVICVTLVAQVLRPLTDDELRDFQLYLKARIVRAVEEWDQS